MDLPKTTTHPNVDLFEKAKHRWNGYHVSDSTFDETMKDLSDVSFLILSIQERKVELNNQMARIQTRGRTCQNIPIPIVQSLIREGDYVVQEKDQLHDFAQRLLSNEWIQELLQQAHSK